MTEFEKQISRAPLRRLPPEWREEILGAAMKHGRAPWKTAFFAKLRILQFPIRNLLWPHPAAWAVLAGCWVLAAVLCLSGPRGPELYAVTPAGVTPVPFSNEVYVAYVVLRDRMLQDSSRVEPEIQPLERRKL